MGGLGLVGSSFVEKLGDRGFDVLSLTSQNFNDYKSKGISTKVFINANGNNFRFKANDDPLWDFDKSVYSLLDSLKSFQSEKYIFFSSIDVYSDKSNPLNNREDAFLDISNLDFYGSNKVFAEMLLQKYHPKWLIFRLGSVVSPMAKKGPFYDLNQNKLFIDFDSTLSIVDIENIHRAFFAVEKKEKFNEIFNLTGSGNVQVRDLIKKYKIDIDLSNYSGSNELHSYEISNNKLAELVRIESASKISKRYFNR